VKSGPKTVEEAQALPEVKDWLSGGYFFGAGGCEGDTICLFVDADGIAKTPKCIRRSIDGPDEWVKVPFSW
jgi:hypothetical protein